MFSSNVKKLSASLVFGLALGAHAGPNPADVYVQSITYGGTGCPQGSVGQSLSNDREQFTLIFDSYIASMGPNVSAEQNTKSCELSINLHTPAGWQYAVGEMQFRGYVQLDQGVVGSLRTNVQLGSSGSSKTFNSGFVGPTARDYLTSEALNMRNLQWSACDASVLPLIVNAQVSVVGNPQNQGQMTVDSVDGKVSKTLVLQWRTCNPTK